jgi:hypothetical protein
MTIDLDTLEAFAGMSVDEIEAILATIDNDDPRKRELDQILNADDRIWRPLPGPQFMAATSPADIVGFGGAAGGGKLLDLKTLVPTPSGWSRVGELTIGDELFDERGHVCRVTALSAIDPAPVSYRVEFDDGARITACADHRWLTYGARELTQLTRLDPEWRARRRAARPSRAKDTTNAARREALAKHNAAVGAASTVAPPVGSVRTTQQIADSLRTPTGRANHAIPVAGALDLPHADLPIPPYVLGAWLGDGTKRNGDITGIDEQLWEEITEEGYTVRHSAIDEKRHVILGLKPQLRELGVLENKHAPMAYLRASREQRLALLQGLMDTDGTVARHSGAAEFCNTDVRIVEAVHDLVTSLGWKVRVREARATLRGKDCGPKWTLKWVASEYVFRFDRKRALQKLATRRTTRFRYIVACTPVEPRPMRCLAVDSPSHLFLVGVDKVPTHNTDLGVGLAMTEHRRSFIVRQEATQLGGIVDRIAEILGTRDGYNGQERVFRLPHRLWKSKKMNMQIDFGSVPNPGDETKYQGRPKDLLVLDEATNIAEKQARFLMGWVRTTDFGQRTRVLMTFNPPTDAAGRWVIEFFGPWLDERHPMPAEPGELRWFATVNGRDLEMPDKRKFVMVKGRIIYDYDPKDFSKDQVITPLSRTFIPSRITDNPYLAGTGYMATLQGLPEPLRSQMLYGDFKAGVEDSAWQVIPTAWVEAAMARWVKPDKLAPMDSMGIDVARGGKDSTVLARRHGMWFDEALKYPGKATPDGPATAGLAVANNRDNAPMHIDVVGVGSSPYDFLRHAKQQVIPINGAETSGQTDQSGKLRFGNLRTQLWWRMREALDPVNNTGIALPVDRQLLTELCAPEWKPSRLPTIYVESREEIIKRIGRSPDLASAYIMALLDTPKASSFTSGASPNARGSEYDPYANLMR